MRVAKCILGVLLVGCGAGAVSTKSLDAGNRSDGSPDTSVGVNNPSSFTLCDGIPALRLRVYGAANPERELRGSMVRTENGFPSFAVDGLCNYYLNGGWGQGADETLDRDQGWRSGVLPSDLRAQLEVAMQRSSLATLQACLPTDGLFDATAWVLSVPGGSAACLRPGPGFTDLVSRVQTLAVSLWPNAHPLAGGIRVSAVATGDDLSSPYPWPLAQPLGDFMLPENVPLNLYKGFSVGVSTLVSDEESARHFRQLREQYLADRTANPFLFFDGQVMSDGRTKANVYMRDALPYEDENGLWPR